MIKKFCELLFAKISNKNNTILYYDCVEIPPISLDKFLIRIKRFSFLEEYHIIYSLIYINRFLQNDFFLSERNIHKITAIAILSSHKFIEDNVYTFKYYSKVFGIELNELFDLEIFFLERIEWKLYVPDQEYENYKLLFKN